MSVVTETWTKNQFDVECVQVTEENIIDVAERCKGEIKYTSNSKRYVRIEVTPNTKPMIVNVHIGDWVLFFEDRFKHYKDPAFKNAYSKKRSLRPDVLDVLQTALSVKCSPGEERDAVAEYYTDLIMELVKGE